MTDKEKIRAEIERRMKGKCPIVCSYIIYEDILKFIDSMQEEPASEDWEKAAKHYLYSNILYDDVYVGNPTDKDCIEMFKAGAKWQKEQMFKDAVICVVEPRYNKEIGRYLSLGIVMNEQIYKAGDIVKLIIIKEDEQ